MGEQSKDEVFERFMEFHRGRGKDWEKYRREQGLSEAEIKKEAREINKLIKQAGRARKGLGKEAQRVAKKEAKRRGRGRGDGDVFDTGMFSS